MTNHLGLPRTALVYPTCPGIIIHISSACFCIQKCPSLGHFLSVSISHVVTACQGDSVPGLCPAVTVSLSAARTQPATSLMAWGSHHWPLSLFLFNWSTCDLQALWDLDLLSSGLRIAGLCLSSTQYVDNKTKSLHAYETNKAWIINSRV